ncbi:hypothetical protein Dform_01793 [Dehalogenimonas formicexedens]|uniref:Uncharacterized protein n=1 Tax=Dehalogenimonas formicexedens TaxID=1839801 RepID=A0A1P8F9K0_9CHLR|nr:hypothetical protein [Dehalogenimonas formicexedens]APV45112.1 hypothetical protein Dform_01793 [Dehalogenimonas formicexedens]
MNKGKLVGTMFVVLIGLAAIIGTFLLASNNPVKDDGPFSDATDVLSGDAAAGAGREARDPLLNTEQGNMLVFFFTLGSLVAGGIIGKYWRQLFGGNNNSKHSSALLAFGILAVALAILVAAWEAFSGNPMLDPALGDVVLFIFALGGAIIGIFTGYLFQSHLAAKSPAEVRPVG